MKTLKHAWRVYAAHPADTLCFLLLSIMLRLMVLTPMLLLADEATKWGALLSPVLYLLIILPARQNAAAVMAGALEGGRLFTTELVSFHDYGKKLLQGIKMTALILMWSLPFLTLFVLAVMAYKGMVDFLTLLRIIQSIGSGETVRGALLTIGVFAAAGLIAMAGLAFHSGTRHRLARRISEVRRARDMGVWFLGMLLFLPFLVVTLIVSRGFLHEVRYFINHLGDGARMPTAGREIYTIAAAALLLVLPLIPLKQLLNAAAVKE